MLGLTPSLASTPHGHSMAASIAPDALDGELLRRAWRLLRPDCWPSTYEETMTDPLRQQMVQMFARKLQRSEEKSTDGSDWAPLTAPSTAPRTQERRYHAAPLMTGVIDRKRAAAGDRDDN